VAFQEGGERLVVGAGGLHGADDLRDPGLPPPALEVDPGGGEGRGRVRDRQLLVHELRVGEADLGHVLGLGDVYADKEPIAACP
jgi:hypothetical protein